MKTLAIVIAAVAVLAAAQFRYDVFVGKNDAPADRYDRWTGHVEVFTCQANGCEWRPAR